jgi:hypothetical protein
MEGCALSEASNELSKKACINLSGVAASGCDLKDRNEFNVDEYGEMLILLTIFRAWQNDSSYSAFI